MQHNIQRRAASAAVLCLTALVLVPATPAQERGGTTVCVNERNGKLRVSDGDACRGPERAVEWTVDGEITRVEGGKGIVVEGIEGGISIKIEPDEVQQRITGACGNGEDGSAIAAVNEDGSVLCTSPHGWVGALDAGDVFAHGSTSLSACDDPDFTGTLPVRSFNEVGPISLPPGLYLPVVGDSNEVTGRPFEWRINKAAGRGNPFIFYQATVRALVQRQDASGADPRTVSAFRRTFHSDGGGYFDVANQQFNVTNQDFGLIGAQFRADYYLYIEASASACAWAQIGGQIAFLRIQ